MDEPKKLNGYTVVMWTFFIWCIISMGIVAITYLLMGHASYVDAVLGEYLGSLVSSVDAENASNVSGYGLFLGTFIFFGWGFAAYACWDYLTWSKDGRVTAGAAVVLSGITVITVFACVYIVSAYIFPAVVVADFCSESQFMYQIVQLHAAAFPLLFALSSWPWLVVLYLIEKVDGGVFSNL